MATSMVPMGTNIEEKPANSQYSNFTRKTNQNFLLIADSLPRPLDYLIPKAGLSLRLFLAHRVLPALASGLARPER